MVLWFFVWVIIAAFLMIQLISLYALTKMDIAGKPAEFVEYPLVSILLAARDEEDKIIRSLTHIHQLDYPKERLEVWIGDDHSIDHTAILVKEFIADKPNFKLINIDSILGKGRGKANVLAHLAHHAGGEFFFITDVDVALPPEWIKGLLASFEPEVGIVSGTTLCVQGSVFETLQSIDWLHFMGYIKSFANLGVSCTSVGNNMAVRAEAYHQTGGYEKMPFSITEDYRLFEQVTANGWQWRNVLNPETLGRATAIGSISEMLHQRKRWLIGAHDLPLNWKGMIVLYGLFLPAILILAWYHPISALVVWGMKSTIQMRYIRKLCALGGIPRFSFLSLCLYEGYSVFNTLTTGIFYFLPIQTKWKRRVYSQQDLV
jgi:cellulose synthase/poly-beta-1,6-N-acetylglucosamine synthase-like glycosyltransferase